MMGVEKGALNIQKSDCLVLLLNASFNQFAVSFLVHVPRSRGDVLAQIFNVTLLYVCICAPLPFNSEEHIQDHGVFCFDLSGRLLAKPLRFVRSSEDSAVMQQNQSGSPETE